MNLYKLTTQDNKTRKGYSNETLWGPGVSHSGTGKGGLCSEAYIHAYESPELAVFLNPYHAGIPNPKLWLCEGQVSESDGEKVGCLSLTTISEHSLPTMKTEMSDLLDSAVDMLDTLLVKTEDDEAILKQAINIIIGVQLHLQEKGQ